MKRVSCKPLSKRLFLLICVLAFTAILRVAADAQTAQLAQPANVGEAKLAAIDYKSGAYEHDVAAVATQVGNWVKERGAHVKKPAIVFDIDDTVLSNWTVISAK